ncbi:MAG: hypothetical protein ABSG46_18600 [Candidatus Binataceae bacterium]|jgi:hypothetical protein
MVEHEPKANTEHHDPDGEPDDDELEHGVGMSRGGRKRKRRGGVAEGGKAPHRLDRHPRRAGGGHLTAGERQHMPKSEFALPGKGEGPKGAGAGSYPIDTEARARNALARGAQHAGPSELATIKRKVHSKYPGIKIGD